MDPAKALEAKARGNAHFKNQAWDEAIKEYSEAIRLDPAQASFFSNRSGCYASKAQYDLALKDAEKVVELKPEWAKGYSRKGLALFQLGRVEDALDCYTEGLKKCPDDANLKKAKDEVMKAARNQQSQQMMMRLSMDPETRELMKKPEIAQRVRGMLSNPQLLLQSLSDPKFLDDDMKKVLRVGFPELAPLFEKMGADMGTKRQAPTPPRRKDPTPPPAKEETTEETKARELQETADACKAEGNTFYKKRKFAEAIEKYEEASNLMPANPTYYLNISAALFMQKKYDECEEVCNKVLKMVREQKPEPKVLAKAYNRLAAIQEKKDNLEKAIELYRDSALEFGDPKIKDKIRALVKKQKKDSESAYLDPAKAEAARQRGNEAFKASKFPVAVKEYTEAIRRNPKDPKAYNNRATAYSKLMAFTDAKRDVKKCLALDPKFLKAWVRKGQIEHLQKEYHKAIGSYEAAMEIDPNFPGLMKVMMDTRIAIQQRNQNTDVSSKEQQRVLNDPEIRAILQDPEIDFILKRAQVDPSILQGAMKDPVKAKKIQTLLNAGVIRC